MPGRASRGALAGRSSSGRAAPTTRRRDQVEGQGRVGHGHRRGMVAPSPRSGPRRGAGASRRWPSALAATRRAHAPAVTPRGAPVGTRRRSSGVSRPAAPRRDAAAPGPSRSASVSPSGTRAPAPAPAGPDTSASSGSSTVAARQMMSRSPPCLQEGAGPGLVGTHLALELDRRSLRVEPDRQRGAAAGSGWHRRPAATWPRGSRRASRAASRPADRPPRRPGEPPGPGRSPCRRAGPRAGPGQAPCPGPRPCA